MQIKLMDSYVKKLIHTCHSRGTFAMGGMAATIPVKNDVGANEKAMESVKADKLREVLAGHDGTWVAHPALVAIARTVFDKHMREVNEASERNGNGYNHPHPLLKLTHPIRSLGAGQPDRQGARSCRTGSDRE